MIVPCDALDINLVTFNYHMPGSLKISYTEIRGAIINEARDFLEDEWRSNTKTLYNDGQISFSQYSSSLQHLKNIHDEYGLNGMWWQRKWFQSLTIKKGGAPPVLRHTIGRSGDVINLGIAKINENFKFRFKEYSTYLTREWRFKFSPSITGNTTDIISKAVVVFTLDYYVRRRKFLRISFQAGYSVSLENFIEFRIEMFKL